MTLSCPVPGCAHSGFARQVHVNYHLRGQHHIPLEKGIGGNMIALRALQQRQFTVWLRANGHRNVSLFSGEPIQQPTPAHDHGEDDYNEEEANDQSPLTAKRRRKSRKENPKANRTNVKSNQAKDGYTNDDSDDEEEEDAAEEEATITVSQNRRSRQATATEESEEGKARQAERLLYVIEHTDESGLDIRPSHANDTHTIVCDDGSHWYAEPRPI